MGRLVNAAPVVSTPEIDAGGGREANPCHRPAAASDTFSERLAPGSAPIGLCTPSISPSYALGHSTKRLRRTKNTPPISPPQTIKLHGSGVTVPPTAEIVKTSISPRIRLPP